MGSIKQRIENKTVVCKFTNQEVTIQTRKHAILDAVMSTTCNKCSSSCPDKCQYKNQNN